MDENKEKEIEKNRKKCHWVGILRNINVCSQENRKYGYIVKKKARKK